MRVPTSAILLSLPLLGAAAEGGAFAQYRAQFQNALGSFGSLLQKPSATDKTADAAPADAVTAEEVPVPVVARPTEVLTLEGWKDTLYSRVQPEATTPEEWWVLITGGNKTCFGHCANVETAFNETAPKLSSIPNGPHTAILNCEQEAILCNSWSVSPGYLYVFEMLPQPAKTDIYYKRLNLTTTTSETISDLYESHSKEEFKIFEGHFHPLDGTLAVNGLSVPVGYVLWFFGIIPSWAMMLAISMGSRTIMGRKMAPPARPRAGGAPAAAAQ